METVAAIDEINMKFELKPFHRNTSDSDFLEDLKRVAVS